MDFGTASAQLFDSVAGQAIVGLFVIIMLNALLGISKAFANGTFAWEYFDLFVRTKIAGRFVPITLILVFGALTPDLSILGLDVNMLTAGGLAAAIPVAASELKSILDNLNFGGTDHVPEGAAEAGTPTAERGRAIVIDASAPGVVTHVGDGT